MTEALIVQMPAGTPRQLMLLFHGAGATPLTMRRLGRRLAAAFAQAAVVSLPGPERCEPGRGRQWYSLREVSEENRSTRVAAALPGFVTTVRDWQARTGVGVEATALIGFSQGATLALESTQTGEALAGRVVGLSGRFASAPRLAPPASTLHLIHGKADAVVKYEHTVSAAERLIALGADVTADVIPFLDHRISDEVAALLIERLQGYLPQRLWREAMRDAPQ